MNALSPEFPKIIWFLWLQGIDYAPRVVTKCLMSWKKHHPDWRIIVLHQDNIAEYINVQEIVARNRAEISPQAFSNIVRINLLAKYGGVWVDATCWCCKPLDSWLSHCMEPGFFAFDSGAKNRPIASWFLASSQNCHLTTAYCEEVNSYWQKNRFSNQNRWAGKWVIHRLGNMLNLHSQSIRFWFFYLTVTILKVYPYHWFHFLFTDVTRNDLLSRDIWDSARKHHEKDRRRIPQAELFMPLPDALKHRIDERQDPVYKLTWKYDQSECIDGCTLDYLLRIVSRQCR